MKAKVLCYCLLFLLPTLTFSQETQHLKDINKDVWMPFTKAFETKDAQLFKSIHDLQLIRVAANANQIKDLDTYMQGYEEQWANLERAQNIGFRFIERITDGKTASERGIYKFTVHPNTENETSYYGKFHVILTKSDGIWKLLVDYDSNENNSIGKEDYETAYALDDYERF